MNRMLKFKQTDEQKVYLSSDWHIFHNPKWEVPIWKMRGFNSIEESNESIIKSINDNVRANDILIYLGDMVLNCSESQFESLLSRINCQTIYTLFGNHNSCVLNAYQKELKRLFPTIDDGIEIYPIKYRNLIYVGNYLEFSVDDRLSVATHYPIHSFNGQSKGALHFFGHIHSTTDTPKLNGRRMDVGFDYHKKPISFNAAMNILDKIPINHEGHH